MNQVQSFILILLHSVTNAHILHLQSKSYSEHKALEAYYTSIGDLVDDFTEAYQGKYGLVTGYKNVDGLFITENALTTSSLDYMAYLMQFVLSTRKELKQDSELQNIIDEIAQLIDSTTYKLKYLK